jgi:hypothetical protein
VKLDESEYSQLAARAAELRISKSRLLRDALRKALADDMAPPAFLELA